ncbi:MAG: hypothetical protein DPW13_13610 [Planctomycetes bacterium]|nr:hypothetical protein [Planctomycetota bacterium]
MDTARRKDHFCTTDTGHGSGDKTDMGAYEANKGLIHVDKDATGGDDGSSWANAYTDLQDAFSQAGDDTFADYDPAACEVWVAEGTYKTSSCSICSDGDKQESFELIDGVGVYGKFAGTETARSQRGAATTSATILTGLIGTASPAQAYHVVTAGSGVTSSAVLDGFTIKKGKANGSSGDLDKGGGLLISGSPTLGQLIIKQNLAKNGGGVYLKSGNPTFTDCAFIDNDANDGSGGGRGAGLYVASGGGGSLEFLRCNFNNNTSLDHGGGVYIAGTGAEPHFTNCLFYRNDADQEDNTTRGGAIYTNRLMVLKGCTFAKNWCGDNARGGGVYLQAGNSVLRNCILWNNEAGGTHDQEGDQLRADNSVTLTVTNSCIMEMSTDWGDTNNKFDPKFDNFEMDDYDLDPENCGGQGGDTCTSSAIDAGEDDDCTGACESGGDVKKRTRKVNLDNVDNDIDMGSLETPSGS